MTFSLLHWCLQASTETPTMDTTDSWLQLWRQLPFASASPMQLAVMGGFQADRPAWVFASGYQAALRAAFPNTAGPDIFAFCLTEQGGHSARDLRTVFRIEGEEAIWLNGAKGWTPLFEHYSAYFVACRPDDTGTDQPGLRVVRLPADAAGVSFEARSPGSFLPELPTARMQLQNVQLDAATLLPGDGWTDYAKPFGAHEELYATAALLAYLLREGRAQQWSSSYLQQLVGALALLCSLAEEEIGSALTQLSLSGATSWARKLFSEADGLWQQSADEASAARWLRDKAIQTLWAGSSEKRGSKAWQTLISSTDL